MTKENINRLNVLFEKMVIEVATAKEQHELKLLYEDFISEGRVVNVHPISRCRKSTLQYQHNVG